MLQFSALRLRLPHAAIFRPLPVLHPSRRFWVAVSSSNCRSLSLSNSSMGFGKRVMSAAGAAVISAILVNPLDVAKTRLQAQAAGVFYNSSNNQFGGHMVLIGPNTPTTCVVSLSTVSGSNSFPLTAFGHQRSQARSSEITSTYLYS